MRLLVLFNKEEFSVQMLGGKDFAMYAQETSVEEIGNNTKTSLRSEPSPENDREQIAVFSQPSQHQMPLFYNCSQQYQQQNFNADFAMYAQEEIGNNTLTPPGSDPSTENDVDQQAVFSQPPEYQMQLFYNSFQPDQQQTFNADFGMYAQETSVEEIGNNTKTSPISEPSLENDREQIAVFSQPPQHQMPLFYNSSQPNQQQNFNAGFGFSHTDFAMYMQEEIGNNTLTPPGSDPCTKNDEDQEAVFFQPPQYQMPLFYKSFQQDQQQNFKAYNENYPYIQNSWNYPNYYGHNYYPSIHGHLSGMMQSAAQYYQQPHHSQIYGDYNRRVNNENNVFNAHESLLKKPRGIRSLYSAKQIFELETYFQSKKYLPRMDRAKLAQKIKLSEKQIKVWFQNRRIRHKKVLSSGPNPTFQATSTNMKEDSVKVKIEPTGNEVEINKNTIDENAEAFVLRDIQNFTQAEEFSQDANFITTRPEEVQHILNALVGIQK
ncbi:unnamed protein product [Psylliodes chrysocephalus]|uniref:Homeobox domain-containing protein n=1 Tax=Psylliodes chrysocephalus TaxID=3402493 RepID=A0A9P0D5L7_9CUCU|nr:unnamed protein product [Psylliodes chrysocephala]